MNDEQTKISELRKRVRDFREKRGWVKDWSARSQAISLVVEAVEFLEHFQWQSSKDVLKNKKEKKEIGYELADVLYWVLAISDTMQIDLTQTFLEKLERHNKRYPVKEFLGKQTKKEKLSRYYELKRGE